jgi:hypothetical protein
VRVHASVVFLPEQPDGGPLFSATLGATTNATDDFDALDSREVESLSASARQAALDAVVRVENPKDTSANTVNCSTCHMATTAAIVVYLNELPQ